MLVGASRVVDAHEAGVFVRYIFLRGVCTIRFRTGAVTNNVWLRSEIDAVKRAAGASGATGGRDGFQDISRARGEVEEGPLGSHGRS